MKTTINYRCYKCYRVYDEDSSYQLEKIYTSNGFILPYCLDCDWFCVPFKKSYKYASSEKQKIPKQKIPKQPGFRPKDIQPYQFAQEENKPVKKDLFS